MLLLNKLILVGLLRYPSVLISYFINGSSSSIIISESVADNVNTGLSLFEVTVSSNEVKSVKPLLSITVTEILAVPFDVQLNLYVNQLLPVQ